MKRRACRVVPCLLLLPLLAAGRGHAQGASHHPPAQGWTWEGLRSAQGVDTLAVDWLRTNLAAEEAAELFSLLGALSRPDAAQLLVSYFEADPSYAYLKAWPELRETLAGELDGLRQRPPADTAGLVQVAHRIARIRGAVLGRYRDLPFYRLAFSGAPLRVLPAPPPPERFRLVLNFAPALALLEILESPGLSEDDVARRLRAHEEVFAALLRHRSQSFYPVAVSREALELSLQRAASDAPLARLYRWAFPLGLLHFAEVREQLPAYRRLVGDLDGRRADIEAHVAARIVPYAPPGLEFSRTVHFLFADGADGWVSDGVAAVDLEFLKDDFDPLLSVLTHETFHAVQNAARRAPWPQYADRRRELLAGVLESIYQEGTATFVAPAQALDAEERSRLAAQGLQLLEELHAALYAPELDEARVHELRDRGIQGAGPFYWLGGRMTEVIVEALGPGAVATALEQGGVRFFELYVEAAERAPGRAPPLGAGLRSSIRTLGES